MTKAVLQHVHKRDGRVAGPDAKHGSQTERQMEHRTHQKRDQRSSIAKAIDSRNPKFLHILREMYANIEDPLLLEELAESAGVSRRHMERMFTKALGEAPASTYRKIKLDKARVLLAETDLSVIDVAAATGFSSANILTRHYKARYGETPYGKSRKI